MMTHAAPSYRDLVWPPAVPATARRLAEEVAAAPKVSLVLCGMKTDDVGWAREAFGQRKDVSLAVHLQEETPLDADETASTGGGEALCFLRHIMSSSDAIGDMTVVSAASPRCGSPHPAATAHCIPALIRAVNGMVEGKSKIEPFGFAPVFSPVPRAPFHSDLPSLNSPDSIGRCLPQQYADLTGGRILADDRPYLSYVPSGSWVVDRANLMSAPHAWLRQAANLTKRASFFSKVGDCCNGDNTCVPWLLERLWPTILGAPMRTCEEAGWEGRRGPVNALCAYPRTRRATSIELRLNVSRVARVAQFANTLTGQETASLLDLITHEAKFEKLRTAGRWSAERKAPCDSKLCKLFRAIAVARGGQRQELVAYLSTELPSELANLPNRAHNRCVKPFLARGWLASSLERVQRHPPAAESWPPLGWQSETYGNLLHSAMHKFQRACLRQMKREKMWYVFPELYGIGWPGEPPFEAPKPFK